MICLFLGSILWGLQGCGGGGGSDSTPTPQVLSGTFVDAAVQGLSYETATQSGVTDSLGTFQYLAGETVAFSIGSISLGQGIAKTQMTPIDLVSGATGADNSTVINILRLLQTMDDDNTPANGIVILDAISTAAVSMTMDFEVAVTAFANSSANIQLLQTLTLLTSFGERNLVDVDDALEHFSGVTGVVFDPDDVDLDGDGYSVNRGDCDDTDAAVNLDATEICDDQVDNDCDGSVDQDCATCTDADGDGFYVDGGECGTVDCDDTDAAVNPGATEDCEDGIDNDCDGTDQDCASCTDADGDGYYAEGGECGQTDCDDTDTTVNPAATEICGDGIDQDCNGSDLSCGTFTLTSQDFASGGDIPSAHACSNLGGNNLSPQLSWSNSPFGTESYVVIVDDEDSPCGMGDNACKHWAVFNINTSTTSFSQDQSIAALNGVTEGQNYTGSNGYAGPCPPNEHSYNFTIYALGTGMPNIAAGEALTRSQFQTQYSQYILNSATLTGVFNP